MDYKQTLEFLYGSMPSFQSVGDAGYKPGLDNIRGFCRSLGDPQKRFRTVHVAGTNGKGSVSHMIASVLMAAGYRTGLYTSPHLHDFRERIRIDGRVIEEADVVGFVERHRQRMVCSGLSFFEMTTALAFDSFARAEVDVAVIETGLGGRLDATNIISPVLSVITNIGLDHTQYLGDTVEKIASEKAGIIKEGVPVVIGQSDSGSDAVFSDRAQAAHSPIVFADRSYAVTGCSQADGLVSYSVRDLASGTERVAAIDLGGEYQRKNILTVLAALDALAAGGVLHISQENIVQGLRRAASATGLQGRWQVLGTEPLVVCDTGHNAHGLSEVVVQIAHQRRDRLFMVIGVVRDKDLGSVIPLMPRDAEYVFTQASIERAMPAVELRDAFAAAGMHGCVVTGVRRALDYALDRAAAGDMVFVGGSTYTVAEIL